MRTSLRGNDQGNAVLMSLILIIVLSTVFMALVPRISAINRYALEYKAQIMHSIEQANQEIINRYDLY